MRRPFFGAERKNFPKITTIHKIFYKQSINFGSHLLKSWGKNLILILKGTIVQQGCKNPAVFSGSNMLKYYYDYYRKLNLAEHFGFDFPLPEIIVGLAIGLCVALIVYDYYRAGMFSLAKALLRHGATGEENAMTLSQLGLEG